MIFIRVIERRNKLNLHINNFKYPIIMKLTKFIEIVAIAGVFAWGCNSGPQQSGDNKDQNTATESKGTNETQGADDSKGIGKFTHVELTHPLDQGMINTGQKIYDLKCSACHKLTNVKLVGPGWKGVTDRRKPEWIMNFVTNTDEMINKDPNAQALLEQCMVRMPNQNLTDAEARDMVEFMRKNDGKK